MHAGERPPQAKQALLQAVARLPFAGVAPQQRRELVAAMGNARRHRKIGDKCPVLLADNLDRLATGTKQRKATQQPQLCGRRRIAQRHVHGDLRDTAVVAFNDGFPLLTTVDSRSSLRLLWLTRSYLRPMPGLRCERYHTSGRFDVHSPRREFAPWNAIASCVTRFPSRPRSPS